jgi:hypothetical protein
LDTFGSTPSSLIVAPNHSYASMFFPLFSISSNIYVMTSSLA